MCSYRTSKVDFAQMLLVTKVASNDVRKIAQIIKTKGNTNMSTLHFTDGVSTNTGGRLHITKLPDGFYVIGHGICEPVDSYAEGLDVLNELCEQERKRNDRIRIKEIARGL